MDKLYVVTEKTSGWDPDEIVICVTDSMTLATVIQHRARREVGGFGIEPDVYEVPVVTNFDEADELGASLHTNEHWK